MFLVEGRCRAGLAVGTGGAGLQVLARDSIRRACHPTLIACISLRHRLSDVGFVMSVKLEENSCGIQLFGQSQVLSSVIF